MEVNRTNGSCAKNDSAMEFWESTFDSRTSWILDTRPTDSDSITSTRQLWDNEIDALYALLSKAKSRRNTLSLPARKLPTELLVRIFEFLSPLLRYGIDNQYPGYRSVTQVCRQWRTAALNHASLWSDILLDETKLWVFERVGKANIHVKGRLQRKFIPKIVEHLPHTRTLQVSGLVHEIECLATGISASAPELHHLSLSRHDSDESEKPKTLPGEFVANIAPHIRTMSLDLIQFPWGLHFLSLRLLNLHWDSSQEYYCSLSQMIKGLENMPCLEELHLKHLPSPTINEKEATVQLPHLRVLHLCGSAASCHSLWASLAVPMSVSITLNYVQSTDLDRRQLVSDLRKRLSVKNSPVFPHMRIYVLHDEVAFVLKSHSQNRIKLYGGLYLDTDVYFGADFVIRLYVQTATIVPSLTYDLLTSANLLQLESFAYDDDCHWPAEQLQDFLSRSPSLTHLELALLTYESLNMLAPKVSAAGSTEPDSNTLQIESQKNIPYLHALKSLTLRRGVLASSADFRMPDFDENTLPTLIRLLKHWRRSLPKFDELQFIDTTLDTSVLAECQEVVPRVVCSKTVLILDRIYESDDDDDDDDDDTDDVDDEGDSVSGEETDDEDSNDGSADEGISEV